MTAINAYVAWRSYHEDPQFAALRRAGVRLRSLGGTNFHGADLTGADFAGARLAGVSFAGAANLARVAWRGAQGLPFARVEGTILDAPQVRDLLVTGRAAGGDFSDADLSGACLREAVLTDANLSRAKLLGADLSGADLSGACVADWLIDAATTLDGAQASHVFLGQDAEGRYSERQPPSGAFKDGEFAALYQAVARTLEFLVKDRLELDALLRAARQLRETTPDLELQSIEKKGEGAAVRFSTPPGFDRAQLERLHADLVREQEVQIMRLETKLEGYENRIADLKDLFRLETQRPLLPQQAIHVMNHPQHFNHSPVTVSGQGNVVNLGEISGQVSTAINQLPEARPGRPDLKALLAQLQQALQQAEGLSEEDKAQALGKVKDIAQAGLAPANPGLAKDSLRYLKGLLADMKEAGSLAQDLAALLGRVGGWFGF